MQKQLYTHLKLEVKQEIKVLSSQLKITADIPSCPFITLEMVSQFLTQCALCTLHTLYVLCSVHTEKFAYGAPYAYYVLSEIVVCMPFYALLKTIKEGFTHCSPDDRIFLLLQDPDLTTPCTGPPSTKHTQQRDRARYDIFKEKICICNNVHYEIKWCGF